MSDLVEEATFALYAQVSREPDPDRARWRFQNKLNPLQRERYQAEAKAVLRVAEAFYRSEAA